MKEDFFLWMFMTAIAVGLMAAVVFLVNAYLPLWGYSSLTATVITIIEKICGICLILILVSWIGMYSQARKKERATIKLLFRQ